jgi:hypothetical protein
MVILFDAAEPSDGAKAFDIGYASFTLSKTLPIAQMITPPDTISSLVYLTDDWRLTCIPSCLCELILIQIRLGNMTYGDYHPVLTK